MINLGTRIRLLLTEAHSHRAIPFQLFLHVLVQIWQPKGVAVGRPTIERRVLETSPLTTTSSPWGKCIPTRWSHVQYHRTRARCHAATLYTTTRGSTCLTNPNVVSSIHVLAPKVPLRPRTRTHQNKALIVLMNWAPKIEDPLPSVLNSDRPAHVVRN